MPLAPGTPARARRVLSHPGYTVALQLHARSIGETKVVQAIAETIRVTAADFMPEFVSAFQME